MSDAPENASKRPSRHPVRRVRDAARPLAVASVVALSATGLGLSTAPAADADRVQQRLVTEGYLAPDHVTGAYDARTGAAVARWQAARGLRADGLVDVVTADHLLGISTTPPTRSSS